MESGIWRVGSCNSIASGRVGRVEIDIVVSQGLESLAFIGVVCRFSFFTLILL